LTDARDLMQNFEFTSDSILERGTMTDPADDVLAALKATVSQASQSPLYADRLRDVQLESLDDFRSLPLTSRIDLTSQGIHGTRAVPIERVCHYGETSGTTGAPNSTWLTAHDFASNAKAIATRHPDVFAPGRILLNRFPFMAAPAHLMQLVAQQGHGVSIPAGNINWDVPFPRALDLAKRTGAQVLAGLPLEPIILAQIAATQGLDPAKDLSIDTFFLGGAPLPTVLQERIERIFGARVIELYGSTETMLLGTSCPARSMHLETELAHCEILGIDSDEPVPVGEVGRLIVTTLGIEGSPLVRLDTGDRVRLLGPCRCGDERPSIVVLGRENDVVELAGQRLYTHEIIDAAAAAADIVDSSVFFTVVLADRLLVRIESDRTGRDPEAAIRERFGDLPFEIELTSRNTLLDVENLSRSPSVYKPVLVSDWRGAGRHTMSVSQGMIEWPAPTLPELGRLLGRSLKGAIRAFQLRREMRRSTSGS
jgi:phenylacetate-CoA ligase